MEKQWWETGWEAPVPKKPAVRRFWLPRGGSHIVYFLDENPFRFWEHYYFKDDTWRNYEVCTFVSGKCAFCEANLPKSYVGFLTIIDTTEWTDRSGKIRKCEKLLMPIKRDALLALKVKKERYGLQHCLYSVMRLETERSLAAGDIFEFEKKVPLEQFIKEYLKDFKAEEIEELVKPFNYTEIFQAKPYEIQLAIVSSIKKEEIPALDDEIEY